MRIKSAKKGSSKNSEALPLIRYLLALICLTLISGCSSIVYYGQSVIGHSRLMLARQPIQAAIQTAIDNADSDLRTKLELALELRKYAVEELALPANGSYSSYIALQRDFPVWTVVAAEEFSIEAKSWCYPVIGCATYRGYFSEITAQRYADSLAQQGLETTVGGATAYSTLGWFDDPLLPSMMRYGEADFAETLFHELAHQQLYINDNSAFSEAFATVVGEQGATQWVTRNRPDLLADYQQRISARADFSLLLDQVKQELEVLYNSGYAHDKLRAGKLRIFDRLKTDYEKLKAQRWQGYAWFDRWFDEPVNNARLAAFSTYRDLVPGLIALLNECDADFARFYQSLESTKTQGEDAVVPEQCISTP